MSIRMRLYDQLRKHYSNRFDTEEKIIENLFIEVEQYIQPSEILGFYLKNLFLEDKEVEFYVFLADKFMILHSDKNKRIFTTIIRIKELSKYNIERELAYNRIEKVIIEFSNQEMIILEPKVDTNNHWAQHFATELEILSKAIINV